MAPDFDRNESNDGDLGDLESTAGQESESAQQAEYYGYSRRPASSGDRRSSRQLWLVSYSDFMTILMIFFLVMYGYTYLAKQSLINQQKRMSYSEFATLIQGMEKQLGNQLKIQDDIDKLVIQMNEKILFGSGSAELRGIASQTLDELANSIKLLEGDVVVQGHTDNVPIARGRFRSNWELSAARAFSVIEALTKSGVPSGRLAAWGFGEHRPLMPNATESNRAQNRRIEIVILKKKQPTA